MRIFKPTGFQWLGPLLVMISGFLNLSNPTLSKTLKIGWLVLTPLSIIVVIIGVINHYNLIKSRKPLK